MELDLEARWQEAVRQKNLTEDRLKEIVQKMESGISIPDNWNERVEASIRAERAEVEKRYGIRIGQTSISCARCGGPWGYGGHVCQDTRFKRLEEIQREKQESLKDNIKSLLDRVRDIGAKKISTISFDGETGSFISQKAINRWIYRGNIPSRHLERIETLIKCVEV